MDRKESQSQPSTCLGFFTEAKLFNPSITKLELMIVNYFFVGFPKRSKDYRFYCPSRPMEIVECGYAHFIEDGSRSHRDIVFEEALDDVTSSATPIDVSIFSAPLNTGIDQNPDQISDVDKNLHVIPPITAAARRSIREGRYAIPNDYVTYFVEGNLLDLADSVNYRQAMNNIFAVQWHEIMENELKFMAQNSV